MSEPTLKTFALDYNFNEYRKRFSLIKKCLFVIKAFIWNPNDLRSACILQMLKGDNELSKTHKLNLIIF